MHSDEPAADDEPAAQGVHFALPEFAEKVLAGHFSHSVPRPAVGE